MAGQRQPTNLIVHNGKSHMSKEEIERRLEQEIKNNTDKITPPTNLSAKLKKEFIELTDELLRVEIMSNLDVDAVARYLIAQDEWLKCYKLLKKMKPVILEDGQYVTNEHYDRLSKSIERWYKQARSAAQDLGMTISSRCKIIVPKAPEAKRESKFDKFRGGKK
ncbi:phage terminase small subunit P27 family [Peribacillus sp. NJ4]|uniref:phage terminase small subunit P27 family n=1 Tax=Peribacillus sp. NJ4 TaxID=3055862 RepID=UPI0025A2F8A4|nr:phage terminase small subunit P27 family [Peribacillus sp. NJ4]MDM5212648.1 phage terminase small subunit P27 family [Peribacillus sp. NJ4]